MVIEEDYTMNDFEFRSPTHFVFGRHSEERIGTLASAYGKKVLVHYGGGSATRSGLLDRVITTLSRSGLDVVTLGGVQPNPRDTLVYEGIRLCRDKGVEFILAVGGGSTIDSAKAIAVGTPYEGDFWDLYSGKAPQSTLPVGVVLTIPAAGSEGSIGSVITREDGLLKRDCCHEFMRPVFAIMNPELTFTLSSFQTACGAADIMAHVLERYLTCTSGVDFTDRLCEAVLSAVYHSAPIVLSNPCNYDARANIMWAGMVAHNNMVGVGRQGDWSCHQIEHEMSGLYDVAHGAGLAVVIPAFMRFQYMHDVMRFAQLATRVFGVDMDFSDPRSTALEGIDRLEAFFRSLGLPTTFDELGAREEDIPLLAAKCNLNNGDLLGFFHPISRAQIEDVLRLACRKVAG